jgi:hypothetical protein
MRKARAQYPEAWSDGSTYKERTTGAKGKTTDGQEEGDMSGNEKGEPDGHVLIELDIACHDADGARSSSRYASGRVPRNRDGDGGRTANDMKSMLRHRGRERNKRAFGRREYRGERTGEGAEMNRNESKVNRKRSMSLLRSHSPQKILSAQPELWTMPYYRRILTRNLDTPTVPRHG